MTRPARGGGSGGSGIDIDPEALKGIATAATALLGSLRGLGGLGAGVAGGLGKIGAGAKGAAGGVDALTGALKSIQTTGKTLGAVAAIKAGFDGLRDTFNEFGALASRLAATSLQFGTTTAAVQKLEAGVGAAGVGPDALRGSLSQLQSQMYGTITENAEAIKAFNRLGVSVTKVGGGFKPVTEVFDQAIEKLVAIEDPTIRAGRAMATVGQAGLDTANYWRNKGGIQAYNDFKKSVEGFGIVLEQDVQAVGAFKSESFRLGLVLQDFKNDVGGPLHEVFSNIAKDVFEYAKGLGPAGTASKPLREAMEGLSVLQRPLAELLKSALKFAIEALPVLVTGLKTIANVVVGLAIGIKDGLVYAFEQLGDTGIAVAAVLLAAFAPQVALFGGLFLLIEDLIVFARGGDSLTGRAVEAFKKWKEELLSSGGERPYWLRFLEEAYGLVVKDIPEAIKKLAAFFSGLLTQAIQAAADAVAKLAEPVRKIAERIGNLLSRAGVVIAEQARSVSPEALGQKHSLPTSLPGPSAGAAAPPVIPGATGLPGSLPVGLVTAPAATVPVANVPGYSGPAVKSTSISAPVTIAVAGQVLDGKDFVKRITPQLEEFLGEQLLSLLRSAQP